MRFQSCGPLSNLRIIALCVAALQISVTSVSVRKLQVRLVRVAHELHFKLHFRAGDAIVAQLEDARFSPSYSSLQANNLQKSCWRTINIQPYDQ